MRDSQLQGQQAMAAQRVGKKRSLGLMLNSWMFWLYQAWGARSVPPFQNISH
jgi:hypothetical protein